MGWHTSRDAENRACLELWVDSFSEFLVAYPSVLEDLNPETTVYLNLPDIQVGNVGIVRNSVEYVLIAPPERMPIHDTVSSSLDISRDTARTPITTDPAPKSQNQGPSANQGKESLKLHNLCRPSLDQEEAAYVMSRIAARMQSSTKEVGINESNLEHIFPKKPSSEWGDPKKLEPFLWHIGNLTMLGKRLNASSGVANLGYPKKRAHYQKASELVMAQQLAKDYTTTWDESTIKDRAKKMEPYITEIWDFDNTSRV